MNDIGQLNDLLQNTLLGDEHRLQLMQDFGRMMNLYHAALNVTCTKLEILDREFQTRFDHNPIHHMEHRIKSPRSMFEKMQRKGLEIDIEAIRGGITDIAGVRVVCNYVDDIYKIAELLVSQSDVELVRVRDYIESPKANGYRSLHLIVRVPVMLSVGTELVPVEVQVRTIAMDMWASMEHEIRYKSKAHIPPQVAHSLQNCAEQIVALDEELQSAYYQATGREPTTRSRFLRA